MAKYMKFNFSDCSGDDYPIIIRFEENLTHAQLMEIADKFQEVFDDFRENGDGWDTDEVLLNKVLNQFGYKYEYVTIDEVVDC